MKKVTFLLLLLVCSLQAMAQVLNQPASWPNTDWTITGTYDAAPAFFTSNPTLATKFSYDDNLAGPGSDNNIAAESAIIDLTTAFDAGETWLFLNASYVYNNFGIDKILIQYFNADTSIWINWLNPIVADTPGAPLVNFCAGTDTAFNSGELNIAGFTATQLSGFKYRIKYDDGGDWVWGFCFSSPTLTSQVPPACSRITGLTVGALTSTTVELSWNAGTNEIAWEVAIQAPGTGIPTGNGDSATTNAPYIGMSLNPATNYEAYVRGDCGADGFSEWVGPVTFLTDCAVFTPDYLATFDTFLQVCWEKATGGNPTTGPTTIGNSAWLADGFANVGFNGANKVNLWQASKREWLLSPTFDLTGGPFQVELDLAIMRFASSVEAGTLGSDDQVQLLISNDDGATWISLNTWNNTTAVPVGGDHYVYNLAAYSGQTVKFAVWASEGTVDDLPDNDVSFDNFQVRNVPTCAEPSALTSTNLSLTSTQVGWTENGTSTSWNIEYGISGFTQGTGTVLTDVTNPYVITNLTSDTFYQFYVQANCGAVDGLSSWTGPSSFYTGYCASVPTLLDGQGVSNVSIGATDFPSFGAFTYENHTDIPVNVFQGVETNVGVTFVTGFTYNTYIWVDFNDNLVFDPSELVYQGESTNGNPTTLDAFFNIPANAPLGEHRMRISALDFGSNPPNPCYNGSFGVTLDFTLNVVVLDCVLPTATFEANPVCDANQFFIEVTITDVGDATTLLISNTFNAATQQVSSPGTYQVGPFPFGTTVKAKVANEQNADCTISSQIFAIFACPTFCLEALPICAGDFIYPSVTGDDVAPSYLDYGCLDEVPDPTWNSIYFDIAGDYTFTLAQTGLDGLGNDIDFIVWGPFNSQQGACYSLLPQNIADCSYSPISIETVELTNVQAGDVFIILITNFSEDPGTYTFTQASGPLLGTNCDIICDVNVVYDGADVLEDTNNPGFGVPIELCGANAITLTASSPYSNTYEWYEDNIPLDIYTQTLTVTESGVYSVVVSGPVCENPAQSIQIPVTIFEEPVSNPAPDLITCDDASGDGVEMFDLESQTATILGDQDPNLFNVTYHLTLPDAANNVGALISPYTSISNSQQIWVRIENVNSTACADISSSFNLVITGATPTATSADMILCDDLSGDGVESFNLTSNDANILNGQSPTDFTVTYYATLADADAQTSPLVSPYTNTINGQTIYARVDNNTSINCYAVAAFDLIVSPLPTANTSPDLAGCDTDGDTVAEYDLTENESTITGEQTGLTITYHTTMADANAGISPIGNPTNYETPLTIVYVRVVDTVSGCFNVTSFNLIAGQLPVTTFTTNFDYEVCPNATTPITVTVIAQNYTAADVSIVWLQDGVVIPGQNGLTLPVLTQGFYEIQVTFNATGCTDIVGQQVILLDNCIIPQGISPDGDGQNDTFDLSNFGVKRIEIFNRLGTLVYSKDNYTNEWYGQSDNGDELPVGTYFYTIVYEGGAKTKSSWVYINK